MTKQAAAKVIDVEVLPPSPFALMDPMAKEAGFFGDVWDATGGRLAGGLKQFGSGVGNMLGGAGKAAWNVASAPMRAVTGGISNGISNAHKNGWTAGNFIGGAVDGAWNAQADTFRNGASHLQQIGKGFNNAVGGAARTAWNASPVGAGINLAQGVGTGARNSFNGWMDNQTRASWDRVAREKGYGPPNQGMAAGANPAASAPPMTQNTTQQQPLFNQLTGPQGIPKAASAFAALGDDGELEKGAFLQMLGKGFRAGASKLQSAGKARGETAKIRGALPGSPDQKLWDSGQNLFNRGTSLNRGAANIDAFAGTGRGKAVNVGVPALAAGGALYGSNRLGHRSGREKGLGEGYDVGSQLGLQAGLQSQPGDPGFFGRLLNVFRGNPEGPDAAALQNMLDRSKGDILQTILRGTA